MTTPKAPEVRIGSFRARVLGAGDVHAHKDFDNPRAVEPRDEPANVNANRTVSSGLRPRRSLS
jgi:hypothetical protein